MTITPEGGRVLGCLAEKQLTTPQQYPLTLNALALACNQATNREPIMDLDEGAVQMALEELKPLHLVRYVLPSHGKSVVRYRHVLDEQYGLEPPRLALLAVLLLRGPQTLGELRARTGRMAEFPSISAVQGELERMAEQIEPLVQLLPRRPGQKEERWQQLLAVESGAAEGGRETRLEMPDSGGAEPAVLMGPSRAERSGPDDRPDPLASEVADLRREVAELRASLEELRQSLGE